MKATVDETRMGTLKIKSSKIRVGDTRASILRSMGEPQKLVMDVVYNREYLHYCLFGLVSGEGVGFWIKDKKLAATTYWTPVPWETKSSGEYDKDGARFSDELVWNCYENLYIDWKNSPLALEIDSSQDPAHHAAVAVYDKVLKSNDEKIFKEGTSSSTGVSALKSSDREPPIIKILGLNVKDAAGIIKGVVSDNSGIAEVRVDGEVVAFDESGQFSSSTFIPVGGKDIVIITYDLKGLSTSETISLHRETSTKSAGIPFDSLNPTDRQAKSNANAIALIVGVGEYSKTSSAEFADRDAQVFYDYANLKLGIPRERIQTLINDKADVVGLLTGVNKWLKRSVRQGESDVYIFFAGHGLASDDGDTAYLIPYDGAPDFLERTAISRDEIFSEIASVNPKSVTVFLDTCYSGDTRGGSRLVAGRPLRIKVLEASVPENFTVLTAAGRDQIAKPLEEVRHGLFSYFLMKGMEGDADTNNDNAITAKELYAFVKQNVIHQSGGSQVPELQGDAERVLVRFE